MAAANSDNKHATGNGQAMALISDKDAQNLLPHLESLERIIKLPVVGAAWDKGQDVYGKVKGKNRVFNWALSAAEDCVTYAVSTAAPIVSKLDGPIQYVDQTLVKGIEQLEVKAPIIKDTPQEIYNQAKTKAYAVVQPHIDRVVKIKSAGQQKASSLKDLAWQKANEVLATQYGSLAVNGVDTTSALAERLLEYYFPKGDGDIEEDNDKNVKKAAFQTGKSTDMPVAANEDPVLHTVQTVGRLSNKISRRVYRNVSRQIKQVQKGNINDYVSSLIAAMRLHQYINFINASVGGDLNENGLNPTLAIAASTSGQAQTSTPNNTNSNNKAAANSPNNHNKSANNGSPKTHTQ